MCGAASIAVAADPGFPRSAPRSAESHPSATSPEYATHLADPSSACAAPACVVSRAHVPFATRNATPLRVVRTSVHAAGFHPHSHPHLLCREITVEFLRFLAVLQSPLSHFSRFRIHKRNLLEARMIITPYNSDVGSFLRAGWLAWHDQLYSGTGAVHSHQSVRKMSVQDLPTIDGFVVSE